MAFSRSLKLAYVRDENNWGLQEVGNVPSRLQIFLTLALRLLGIQPAFPFPLPVLLSFHTNKFTDDDVKNICSLFQQGYRRF